MHKLELDVKLKKWPKNKKWKTRVLLLAINHKEYYSLPIRILALICNKNKNINDRYDIKYFERELKDDPKEIFDRFVGWRPDIIGISVNIWNRNFSFELAKNLKQILPKICIIAGGQEMTNSVIDYLYEVPYLDYIIDGEGELPFIQFLENWDARTRELRKPESVSGLHYRRDDKTVFTRHADTFSSLEDIPSVILAGLISPDKVGPLGVLLEGTRGCPFKCSFCFEAKRRGSPIIGIVKRLQDEIEYMVPRGVSLFHIMDPILCNSNNKRLGSLSKIINDISKKYDKKINISVEVYGDRITEDIAKKIGCFSAIDVGLQSTNPKTLNAINRHYSHEKFCEGIKKLKNTNSIISIYLIIGLPYETFLTCLQGIQFVTDQQPTKIFLNELILLNGTELRQRATEYKYEFDPNPPYLISSSQWISEYELAILNNLAIDLVRRHNLSFEALPQKKPMFKITRSEQCLNIKVHLKKTRKENCIGYQKCTENSLVNYKEVDKLCAQANNKNIEFIVDPHFSLRELLHQAVQFQLAGANRLKVCAPINYFSDLKIISRMINSGIWHFKIIILIDDLYEESDISAIKKILSHIKQQFSIIGRGHIRPYLQIILFTQGREFVEIKKAIDCLRDDAESISLPDIKKSLSPTSKSEMRELFADSLGINKIRKKVTDPSMMGVRPNYWLKLPSNVVRWVVEEVDKHEKIIELFNSLDLSCSENLLPLCYQNADIGKYNIE